MLAYNAATKAVELKVDRAYTPGQPVYAWCGPQPNSRLLINYGIVDESNPYDKLQLTITLPSSDPLYKSKRDVLQSKGLSTMQTFDLKRSEPLPPLLLPYMRLAHTTDPAQLQQVRVVGVGVGVGGMGAAGKGGARGGRGGGMGAAGEGAAGGRWGQVAA
jgi:histone-lysine N-methyltransferase SETD3